MVHLSQWRSRSGPAFPQNALCPPPRLSPLRPARFALPRRSTGGVVAIVRTIAMFELTFLVADANSTTLVVALFGDAFGAGIRPEQAIDAMAVIYTITTMSLLVVALIFVKPTQFVV